MGRQIETIKLHGSVELAPLIGLSDVIVDIVESGTTLRENKLVVVAEIAPSSARLIANKSKMCIRDRQKACPRQVLLPALKTAAANMAIIMLPLIQLMG